VKCDQTVISRKTGEPRQRPEMPIYQAFRSTPGGTRTPNLLIRSPENPVTAGPCPSRFIAFTRAFVRPIVRSDPD